MGESFLLNPATIDISSFFHKSIAWAYHVNDPVLEEVTSAPSYIDSYMLFAELIGFVGLAVIIFLGFAIVASRRHCIVCSNVSSFRLMHNDIYSLCQITYDVSFSHLPDLLTVSNINLSSYFHSRVMN